MSIKYTTEGVLMLPGGANGETAKVRWIKGEALIKIHQHSMTLDLTAAQFQTLIANADVILASALGQEVSEQKDNTSSSDLGKIGHL